MEGPAEQLLTLLLEDAAPDAVRDLGQRYLDESGPGTEPSVRAQVELALRLRARLDRYKRRASELAALYDTAGDLSALRDVEQVLQAIVQRSRALLGTEVAYLMLIDEDRGDTYMRTTEGTLTPSFIDIRLPLGVGLGGLVAKSGAPHWTSDYVTDSGYLHAIDDVVSAERLTAILGVPLTIGRRVLGVLFAADRDPRPWAQEDVSLLASLGTHAAIALENASLFQEIREGMTRLGQAKSLIEEHNAVLERAAEMHERLTALVLRGGDLRALANAVCDVLDGSLLVTDPGGRVLVRAAQTRRGSPGGGHQDGPAHDEHLVAQVRALVEQAVTTRATTTAVLGESNGQVTPVVAADACLGALVFLGPPLSAPDARALERAATVTALLWVNQRAQDEAENRVRGELLAEALHSQNLDVPALSRRAALLGVDLTVQSAILVAVSEHAGDVGRLRTEAAAFVAAERGLLTVQRDSVVMLLPGQDPAEAAQRAVRRLRTVTDGKTTVGAAGPVADLHQVAAYLRQAERCVRALRMLGRAGEGAAAAGLGIHALLVGEAGEELARAFVEQTLSELVRYDRARGTCLLDTVEQYFDHDGNVGQAAQALFIHANTLYQRLERVDHLLGEGWRSGDRSLDVRLALKMRRLVLE